ncbi:amino acid ABC transporter substrate-binding protein [Staphylococcus nepalensis]|jgi:L-cystine transport system substrate-binding protein|uniref:Amino acid ABC transporter substrate-binding protein n=3 Tax=Staphylococcus nepalensis TaxID=214473 RepID=A0ABS3L0P8_9STAP|nr:MULTISPECIES: amino acid ABC transporter substrate-binding protein [Staphylococcus]ATH59460.1 amino acid ABC transporter substrate-binding protein [Staphylococcus nepalensis]ATH64551.1 amino acid ABC transporter substrate-binding protein [Staphylococcus nepalensis]AWI43908.1 amino acid ABC transporter substrate-binding protein [Staphylococcus nepalensis]MBO1205781.1 amino acid ABC transporter substrate-binding protein [Staphylococcus nepalensis]MBO1212809.1 amino acid ABC transporter substr
MNHNKYFLLVIGVFITMLLSGCNKMEESDNQKSKKEIKVAISAEVNPPYLYTDEHNEFTGLDIDYLKRLEKKLPQYQFKYEVGEEESNLVGIGAGKFDMGINWFFKTPEREQQFLYQDVPYSYALPLIVVNKNNADIHSLNDLPGKKLTPMAPSGGLYSILSQYNKSHTSKINIDTIQEPSNGDNLKMISDARRDAIFLNWNTYNAIQKQIGADVKIGGIVKKEPLHIVYNKKHQKLHDDIDQATQELKNTGELQKLSKKYFDINVFDDLDEINKQKDKLEVQS